MPETRPAGFWVRAVALAIDLLVLMLVDGTFKLTARRLWGASVEDSAVLHSMTTLFTLIFAGVYVTILHAAAGQTIGKLVVRAHVVLVDGGPVPVGVALLRFFAYFASCVTLGLGYLMAGLRRDKRALHDLIAGTRVERRLPERAAPPIEPAEAAVPPIA
ncbi:MAG TPA: RDD family protein [Candidatus Acidoferrum sp.]|nr:RDD family protein [Candidatus Acidoferrum sp.]